MKTPILETHRLWEELHKQELSINALKNAAYADHKLINTLYECMNALAKQVNRLTLLHKDDGK